MGMPDGTKSPFALFLRRPSRFRRRRLSPARQLRTETGSRVTTAQRPKTKPNGPVRIRRVERLEDVLIDPDIARARTLPAWIYSDPAIHELVRERVFARSWQWVAEESQVRQPGQVHPFLLLPDCL